MYSVQGMLPNVHLYSLNLYITQICLIFKDSRFYPIRIAERKKKYADNTHEVIMAISLSLDQKQPNWIEISFEHQTVTGKCGKAEIPPWKCYFNLWV